MLKKIDDFSTKLIHITLTLILASIATSVFINVVLRYAFFSGIFWSDEFARIAFVWLVFLGSIIGVKENMHVKVSILENKIPEKYLKYLVFFQNIVMLAVMILFLLGTWQQFLDNVDKTTAVLRITNSIYYIPGLICAIGIGAILIRRIFKFKTIS